VARPARELDGRRRAPRETACVGARVAEHRCRDLVVRREAAGEEDRPVAAVLERRLAEIEDDDAALMPPCRATTLRGEEPRLHGLLVDRQRRGVELMPRARLLLRRLPLRSGLPWGLRLVRGLRVARELAQCAQPRARVRREARAR